VSDLSREKELLQNARASGHRLTGIIGGVSIGVFCITMENCAFDKIISDIHNGLQQAQDELDNLRASLRELDSILQDND
jgi:hypothetical protein